MMTSLVMVYGNEIMVKGLNMNKASSTFNFDVETGLATISGALCIERGGRTRDKR